MIIIKKEDNFKKENLLTFHLKCKIIKLSHKNHYKMKRVKKEGKWMMEAHYRMKLSMKTTKI